MSADSGSDASERAEKSVADFHREVLRSLLAPVLEHLDDSSVSEVLINGPDEVFVEREGRLGKVETHFRDAAELEALARGILQFSGKRLTPDNLSVEARLYDGSRVHVVQPPAARSGICIAIRKFPERRLTLEELVTSGSLSDETAEYLRAAMFLRKNIIVSGGTGSGKTTLLNVLSEMIGVDERVIVIEDVTELQLSPDRHVVQFEVSPPDRYGRGGASIRELFRASLRMRPDRIIVGECRSGEALEMVQAMNSGHSGSLSTVHANNPRDSLLRLETLCLMSDVELPLTALRMQLASAIDVIVQIARIEGRRLVCQITEVMPDDEGGYRLCDLFRLERGKDGADGAKLAWTGARAGFADDPLLGDFAGAGESEWLV